MKISKLTGCALWIVAIVPAWGASESAPGPDKARQMELQLDKDNDRAEAFENRSVTPPPSVPAPFSGIETDCPTGVPAGTINLTEAITRALCTDPRTRQTWAVARAQAAEVGIERAAFLPKASASIDAGLERVRQDEKDTLTFEDGTSEEVTVSNRATGMTGIASLDFTWLLFDFGQRDAAVNGARQTLLAATATHDDTVQTVFLDAATAYYALIAAQSTLSVTKEVEQFSLDTLAEAEARTGKQNDTNMDKADRLQAKSAAAQATLDRSRAEGALQEARGRLASLLGLSPDVELSVDAKDAPLPAQGVVQSIGELMEQARASHPAIRAAQARVAVAQANVDAAKRRYRPTVSLVQGNRREHDALGVDRWENSLTLQLSIPLYEGAHSHQKRAALAEFDSARAEAMSTEQQVAIEVWTAFQSLKTESTALEHATPLLETARELLKEEQDLFAAGNGDMLDLIFAQQAVAEASVENLQALTNWHTARLRLAASLGQLGFWAITPPSDRR